MARILIAEDEAHIHRMLSFRLERAGHVVVWAQNGQQAVELAQSFGPDLAIFDAMMPVMDGVEALRQIKANASTQRIPVIMLTAASQEKDVVKGLENGADDYVTKPFSFPELLARVNRILSTAGKTA